MTDIFIGTRTYSIKPLARREARKWREQVQEQVYPLIDQVGNIISLDMNTSAGLAGVIQGVKQELPRVLAFPDIVWDLLLAYSPEINAESGPLDATATDEQVMQAFMIALKQAYPLGGLMSLLGRQAPATSPSSPPPNGASLATAGGQSNDPVKRGKKS